MTMNTSQSKTYEWKTTVLKGKFTAIKDYLKKMKTFQINNLTLHLQELEEQQQTKPRVNRRKEITKIKAELNDIETKRTIQTINKSRSWFFENINKIDKSLSRLMKKKRERTQIHKIRSERGQITMDTREIQRSVRNYYEQLYAEKYENLGKMGKYLETYNFPNLNQEEAESLNRLITPGEIEVLIKKLSGHKSPGTDSFT